MQIDEKFRDFPFLVLLDLLLLSYPLPSIQLQEVVAQCTIFTILLTFL